MLTKIAENIYRKIVPLPNNPLREINVYIIKGEAGDENGEGSDVNGKAGDGNGEGRSLIIDTGFNRPECEEALMIALEELDIQDADIFVTHLHSDHCGLVPRIAEEGRRIFSSETDGEIMNFEAGNLYWQILDDMFLHFGFPKAQFGRNTDIHPGRKYVHDKRINFTYVTEDDVLEYGGYKLRPILTPGHTPGHMGLYDAEKKVYFCGDHILGTITPNITIEISSMNPLNDYLESLKRVDQFDVELLLSAHGTPIENMHERIAELLQHHADRLNEAEYILGDKWKNAFEVARDMTWEINCRNWEEFPAPQKWFATGEAISHLQYLYFTGRIQRKEVDGIYVYARKDTQ